MLYQARKRAKKHGIPINIDHDDIVVPKVCPVLGIPLFVSDGLFSPNSPSLDRIVPELGYTKGNVVVISHRANTMKSDATLPELLAVVRWLQRRIKPHHFN